MKNKIFKMIVEYIKKNMPTQDLSQYCDNGAIYYMNGNDSTDFDWRMNDRTCEFFMYWKSTEWGAIKAWVNKNGMIEGYVYDTPNAERGRKLDTVSIGDTDTSRQAKAYRFKHWLNNNYDKLNLWDKQVA